MTTEIIYQINKVISIESDKEKNVHIILFPQKVTGGPNGTYECVMTEFEFKKMIVNCCMYLLREE